MGFFSKRKKKKDFERKGGAYSIPGVDLVVDKKDRKKRKR